MKKVKLVDIAGWDGSASCTAKIVPRVSARLGAALDHSSGAKITPSSSSAVCWPCFVKAT